jgi:hypothetical protein
MATNSNEPVTSRILATTTAKKADASIKKAIPNGLANFSTK